MKLLKITLVVLSLCIAVNAEASVLSTACIRISEALTFTTPKHRLNGLYRFQERIRAILLIPTPSEISKKREKYSILAKVVGNKIALLKVMRGQVTRYSREELQQLGRLLNRTINLDDFPDSITASELIGRTPIEIIDLAIEKSERYLEGLNSLATRGL